MSTGGSIHAGKQIYRLSCSAPLRRRVRRCQYETGAGRLQYGQLTAAHGQVDVVIGRQLAVFFGHVPDVLIGMVFSDPDTLGLLYHQIHHEKE